MSDTYLDRSAWLKHSELLLVGHKILPALPFYFVWSSGLVTHTNFELVRIGLIWLINFYIVCMSSVGVMTVAVDTVFGDCPLCMHVCFLAASSQE